jgi:hypothetical protein
MSQTWTNPVAASIRFGDLVAVMTTEPGAGIVLVEDGREGQGFRWIGNMTALHKPVESIQLSWNSTFYEDVFGRDQLGARGRANRLRLAQAGAALWRSVNPGPSGATCSQ